MATAEQVVYPWQRKLKQRVSSCLALTFSILAASVIGTVITLLVWVTLA